jgi:CxxC-x17-CxxC domain-containing protein
MEFQDRQLTCQDCGQPFVFTAGEQEFYSRKGFKEEPKRCKPCREARRARRGGDADGPAGPRGEPEDDIGNRAPARGPREVREPARRGPRELHDAVCATCGATAQVPFKPTPGRPVYCRDCFGKKAAPEG